MFWLGDTGYEIHCGQFIKCKYDSVITCLTLFNDSQSLSGKRQLSSCQDPRGQAPRPLSLDCERIERRSCLHFSLSLPKHPARGSQGWLIHPSLDERKNEQVTEEMLELGF